MVTQCGIYRSTVVIVNELTLSIKGVLSLNVAEHIALVRNGNICLYAGGAEAESEIIDVGK